MARWLIVEKWRATISNVAIISAPDKGAAIKIYYDRHGSSGVPEETITAYNTETNEDFYFYT